MKISEICNPGWVEDGIVSAEGWSVVLKLSALGWLVAVRDWDALRLRSRESAIAKVKQELKGERNVGMIAHTTPLRSKIYLR